MNNLKPAAAGDDKEGIFMADIRMTPIQDMEKRRPKKRRANGPVIAIVILSILCFAMVGLVIHAFAKDLNRRSTAPVAQSPTGVTERPALPAVAGEAPAAEPEVPETPAAAAPDEALSALFAEADFIAAGYDYQGAIELLRASGADESQIAGKISEYEEADSRLSVYQNMSGITHIFFHSLVADNARAFDGEATQDGYNLYMTTVSEFEAILESLYERGYVLVTPYDVAGEVTDESGTHFGYREIRLPEGKKPFMMSQDDLNYYGYMIGGTDGSGEIPVFANDRNDGFASRIVIGEDGYPTCEYMDAAGNVTTGDYDLVPILERFLQAHPDFSYHGARATLAFTGYEGVLGYRTKPSYEAAMGTEAYQREVENAKAVAQCLREHGWILASHSYGHPPYGSISDERVISDSDKWENTVQPIIGETDILIYPHGSDIAGIEHYDSDNVKFNALYEDGYRYFFNVDNCVSWHQMGDNYFRGNRRNLDGYRMYHHPDSMNDLIDARAILDPDRPLPVPEI